MFFKIKTDDALAIYDQVVRQIKFVVAGRGLQPGDRVPSVRELSKQLAINPNTVARAYRQLQDDGVLETVRGLGLQVTPKAPARCRTERTQLIRQRLRDALQEARDSGLSEVEIGRLIERELRATA